MAVIEYREFNTAPLPLGEDMQAVASKENRQSVGPLGTPPKLSSNTRANDK